MAKEKLRSGYLNRDIIVDFQNTEVNGLPTILITHDSLEDVIFNQIPNECNFMVNCQKIVEHVSSGHAVVQCILSDDTGRTIPCIGESVSKTLYTEIARGIPVTMAEIRAFDRAAIRYLDLPGKVYSNEEGVQADTAKYGGNPATIVDPVEFADADVIGLDGTELDNMSAEEMPKTIVSEEVPSEPSPQAAPENPEPAPKAAKKPQKKSADNNAEFMKIAGNMKVTFGKFQNAPKTVAEICNDPQEKRWIEYVIQLKNPGDQEKKKQIKCIRFYWEHMKEAAHDTDVA